jgi:hypothetical protein
MQSGIASLMPVLFPQFSLRNSPGEKTIAVLTAVLHELIAALAEAGE